MRKSVLSFVISSLSLLGCSSERIPAPMCRTSADSAPLPAANAGCLIKFEKDIITLTHRLSGKLDVPGGTSDKQESAQCTAHREVWEETGFNVEVGELLGVNERGFHVFNCRLDAGFRDSDLDVFPVPDWATTEVVSIQRVNPYETQDREWRFPDQLVWLRDMYTKAN